MATLSSSIAAVPISIGTLIPSDTRSNTDAGTTAEDPEDLDSTDKVLEDVVLPSESVVVTITCFTIEEV